MAKSALLGVAIAALVLSAGAIGGGVYMFFIHQPSPSYGTLYMNEDYSETTSGFHIVPFNAGIGGGVGRNLTRNALVIETWGHYHVDVCITFNNTVDSEFYGAYLRFYDTGEDLLVSQVCGTDGNVTTVCISGRLYLHEGDELVLYAVTSNPTGFQAAGDDVSRYTFVSVVLY